MDFRLLVKTMPSGQIEASVLEIPACRVEAASREEAIEALKSSLFAEMKEAEVVDLQVPMRQATASFNAWKNMFGAFKDDIYFQEVMDIIQAERDALGDEEIDPAYYLP